MDIQWWSWLLGAVGLAGFFLAGKKVWWSWYINIFCQILWFTYAIVTEQYGFIATAIAYTVVFTKNAISWTKEHQLKKSGEYEEFRDFLREDTMRTASIFPKVGSLKNLKVDPKIVNGLYTPNSFGIHDTHDMVITKQWAECIFCKGGTYTIEEPIPIFLRMACPKNPEAQ